MPHKKRPKSQTEAHEQLVNAAELFEGRNSVYGYAYRKGGNILHAYFPDGITLKTPDDFQRFMSFAMCSLKLNRYSQNMEVGGHEDSAHDLIVYSAMLAEITDEQ